MNYIFLVGSIFLSFLLVQCSHVNNLHKYNLSGETLYFEEIISSSASEVEIVYETGKSEEDSTSSFTEDIATAVGASILSAETERKLRRAADPRLIVENVSFGIEDGLVKYLRAESTRELDDRSNFIVTTILDECKLRASSHGVYISVRAETKITDRNTGSLVWENSERESVPLRKTGYPYHRNTDRTIKNITIAADLSTLSEEQIRGAVESASIEVGREMGETLRRDIIEANKKKAENKS